MLQSLHNEIKYFPLTLHELREIKEDAIYTQYTRPPTNTEYVSGARSCASPVERIVIHMLMKPHVEHMERVVRACIWLYQESSRAEKVMLIQTWRGKHHKVLPDDMLLHYERLKICNTPLRRAETSSS